MNIFLTLGTTPFDSLVKYVDNCHSLNKYTLIIQTTGNYSPTNHNFFTFSNEIEKYYSNADVVITHAGAGSIYNLLEKKKKIIVVPNFERVDKHQSDISKYVEKERLGLVCWDFKHLVQKIEDIQSGFELKDYNPEHFFKYSEIASILFK